MADTVRLPEALLQPPLACAELPPLRKVLVVQHVPFEPLGTLDRLLRAHKIRIRYINFARAPQAVPDIGDCDGLIVLGGPMNVDEQQRHPHLHTELKLIEQALRKQVPVLGICLGAQLLAHALGAPVGRNPQVELGWHTVRLTPQGLRDPVLKHLGAQSAIFQWHGDTFAIPATAEHLAESDLCANQAFRWGQLAYGLQFHLEVDLPLVERWMRVHQHELELSLGLQAEPALRLQTAREIDGAMARGDALFSALLAEFGWRARPKALHLGHRTTGPIR